MLVQRFADFCQFRFFRKSAGQPRRLVQLRNRALFTIQNFQTFRYPLIDFLAGRNPPFDRFQLLILARLQLRLFNFIQLKPQEFQVLLSLRAACFLKLIIQLSVSFKLSSDAG